MCACTLHTLLSYILTMQSNEAERKAYIWIIKITLKMVENLAASVLLSKMKISIEFHRYIELKLYHWFASSIVTQVKWKYFPIIKLDFQQTHQKVPHSNENNAKMNASPQSHNLANESHLISIPIAIFIFCSFSFSLHSLFLSSAPHTLAIFSYKLV